MSSLFVTDMSVTFDVNKELFAVPYNKAIRSKFLKQQLKEHGNDFVIRTPTKYMNFIHNYIFFLRGEPLAIYDRHNLKACFNLCTYFVDHDYFNFLMSQLFNNWAQLFMVCYEDITLDLQTQILLRCPHSFLPDTCLNNKTFMNSWIQNNTNKQITVNNREVHHFELYNDLGYSRIFSTYCTVDDKIVGRDRTLWLDNDDTVTINRYTINDKKEGVEKYNLFQIEEYHNDVRHGLQVTYYHATNNPKKRGMRINGEKHGLWRRWYDKLDSNGHPKPESKGYFVHGLRQGVWLEWKEEDNVDGEPKKVYYVNDEPRDLRYCSESELQLAVCNDYDESEEDDSTSDLVEDVKCIIM